MKKTYIDANGYLLDTFRLARKILDSGWLPEDIIALWRGGAPVGIGIHEFFCYHGVRARSRVLKCHSYTGIRQQNATVEFENAEEIFSSVVPGSRLLVVDDVFDTGRTAEAVVGRLAACKADLRVATVYWKPAANLTKMKPDYYVRATDEWVVFPHEMEGLTPEEIRVKDPNLFALLKTKGAVK